MRNRTLMSAVSLCAMLVVAPATAHAQVTWNWSFGSNSGTFSTNGSAPGGIAAPGVYSLTDFSVSSSGQGATIGSMSGGQYAGSGYFTNLPYDMTWNGSAVTLWNSAGTNGFDWWVFTDNGNPSQTFLFGWQTGNVNTASEAVYYPSSMTSSPVTVAVATTATPEPATVGLFALGLAGIGAVRRRKTA